MQELHQKSRLLPRTQLPISPPASRSNSYHSDGWWHTIHKLRGAGFSLRTGRDMMAHPPFTLARHHIFILQTFNTAFAASQFYFYCQRHHLFLHGYARLWMLYLHCADLSAAKRSQKTQDPFRHPYERHHRPWWTKLRHHHRQSQLTCF